MPHPTGVRIVLFAAVAILVICMVPYLFPMAPVASPSYIFGYNNTVGSALFLLLAIFGAYWTRNSSVPEIHTAPRRMPYSMLWFTMAIMLVLSGAMAFLLTPHHGYQESVYFIHRLELMQWGKVPYRDFEFAYGAGLLYGPLWLGKLFHLGASASYELFWALSSVLGVFILFECIRLAADARMPRTEVFLIFYVLLLFSLSNNGLNSTAPRFLLPIYGATLVFRLRTSPRGRWLSIAFISTWTVLLLLVSPEMGVAFAIGSVVYCALTLTRMDWTPLVALLASLAVIAALAVHFGIFQVLQSFSAGGNNLPIYPASYIVVLFAALWVGLAYIAQRYRERRYDALVYWVVIGFFMVRGALGRADLGHVLSYGMPVLLVVSLQLAGNRRFRYVVFVIAAGYYLWSVVDLHGQYRVVANVAAQSASRSSHASVVRGYADLVLGKSAADELAASAIQPKVPPEAIYAPLGYAPEGWGIYDAPNLDYGYYQALENLFTPAQVQAKIAELQQRPDTPLILPRFWPLFCIRTADNASQQLNAFYDIPYWKKPVNEMRVYAPLCDYIHQNYLPVSPIPDPALGDFRLWVRQR